jgi:hypothetical protein
MSGILQASLINQIVAEAMKAAEARRRGLPGVLHLEGRVFEIASGKPASALSRKAFQELIASVTVDGVFTDRERAQLAEFLASQGLTLVPSAPAASPLNLDAIDLPG